MLEYPSDEASPAAVGVVRHEGMPRVAPGGAFETTLALDRGDARLGGAVYELAGTRLDVGSTLPIELDEGESALVWCLDGRIQVDVDGAAPVTGVGVDLVSVAAVLARRQLRVASQAPSHVLHAVHGSHREDEDEMSHEPHPRTDTTAPGSSPADEARPNSELERQRTDVGLPGQPTRNPLDDEPGDEDTDDAGADGPVEVPPPRACPTTSPRTRRDRCTPDPPAHTTMTGPAPDDPLHASRSTSDVTGVPRGSD